jgi:Zn-dependent alcohol dehydrogenase
MAERRTRGNSYQGSGLLTLADLPVPEPRPGEIVVKVGAERTCGALVQTYLRGYEFAGSEAAVGKGGRMLGLDGLPGGPVIEVDVATAFSPICSGVVNTRAPVTRKAPLEAVEEAQLSMRDGAAVKVAIIPNAA